MAYPTGVSFQLVTPTVGAQPIHETSATKKHELGTVVRATDSTYGEGSFIYLAGAAETAQGDFCFYDSKAGTTVRAEHGATGSNGPGGVAMSANVASYYGWYQIEGATPVKAATVAANAALFLTSTGGQLDDSAVANDVVDGIVSVAATSSGYATCQLNRPNVTGLASGGDVGSSFFYATLSAATEAADAIVVTGQVKNLSGTNVTAAKQVVVRTLAVTDGKGDITVTAGTEKKTVNPATGENVSWIATTAAGAFAVSVANDQAEVTLISVQVEGGLTAALTLTFAP